MVKYNLIIRSLDLIGQTISYHKIYPMNKLDFKTFDVRFQESEFSKVCDSHDLTYLGFNPSTGRHIFYYYKENNQTIFQFEEESGISALDVEYYDAKRKTETSLEMLEDISDKIEYEFYPTEQCEEIPAEILYNKLTPAKKSDYSALDQDYFEKSELTEFDYTWNWGHLKVSILGTVSNEVVYLVYDQTGKILSGFVDTVTTYQTGDGDTKAWINEYDDLVIENCGDVSSLVVIKIAKNAKNAKHK